MQCYTKYVALKGINQSETWCRKSYGHCCGFMFTMKVVINIYGPLFTVQYVNLHIGFKLTVKLFFHWNCLSERLRFALDIIIVLFSMKAAAVMAFYVCIHYLSMSLCEQ